MADHDKQHTVSESADKITLKTKIKRGSGTRDQDKLDVKVKGDDPEETVQKLGRTLDALGDENIAIALRDTQPGKGNEQ